MRIEVILEDPRVFEPGRRVKLTRGGRIQDGEIEFLRSQHGRKVLKLRGIDSIAQAESLVGWDVAISDSDLPTAPEGQFYTFHLRGCAVSSVDGENLGTVTEVVGSGAEVEGTPILKVEGPRGEILIPMAVSYIKSVDLMNRQIVTDLPEDLRDLNA